MDPYHHRGSVYRSERAEVEGSGGQEGRFGCYLQCRSLPSFLSRSSASLPVAARGVAGNARSAAACRRRCCGARRRWRARRRWISTTRSGPPGGHVRVAGLPWKRPACAGPGRDPRAPDGRGGPRRSRGCVRRCRAARPGGGGAHCARRDARSRPRCSAGRGGARGPPEPAMKAALRLLGEGGGGGGDCVCVEGSRGKGVVKARE